MKKTVEASKGQMAALMELPQDKPIIMLNLLKFKDKVEESGETGQEAYQKYGASVAPYLEKSGGKIIWSGTPMKILIGPEEDNFDNWDEMLLVEYPNVAAFLSMVREPDYPHHERSKALDDSRLIACLKD